MSDGNPNSPTESDSEGSYNGDIKSSPSPDDEDQLLPELREVWKLSSFKLDTTSECSSEDSRVVKAKLQRLKLYVADLRANYNDLLRAFERMEEAAKNKIASLEAALRSKSTNQKTEASPTEMDDFASMLRMLREEKEQAEANLTLLQREKGRWLSDREELKVKDTQLSAVEGDLKKMLDLIGDGLTTGVLKLSELSLHTKDLAGLPAKDLPLKVCTCAEELKHYREELGNLQSILALKEDEVRRLEQRLGGHYLKDVAKQSGANDKEGDISGGWNGVIGEDTIDGHQLESLPSKTVSLGTGVIRSTFGSPMSLPRSNLEFEHMVTEGMPKRQEEVEHRIQEEVWHRIQEEVEHRMQEEVEHRMQEEVEHRIQEEVEHRMQEEVEHRIQEEVEHRIQEEVWLVQMPLEQVVLDEQLLEAALALQEVGRAQAEDTDRPSLHKQAARDNSASDDIDGLQEIGLHDNMGEHEVPRMALHSKPGNRAVGSASRTSLDSLLQKMATEPTVIFHTAAGEQVPREARNSKWLPVDCTSIGTQTTEECPSADVALVLGRWMHSEEPAGIEEPDVVCVEDGGGELNSKPLWSYEQCRLSDELEATRQSLSEYRDVTAKDLVRRDEELLRLRSELASAGHQRQLLEQQVELARARVQALEASQGAKEEEIRQLHTQIEELMADLDQCSSLLTKAKEKEEEYELGISQQYQEMMEVHNMSGEMRKWDSHMESHMTPLGACVDDDLQRTSLDGEDQGASPSSYALQLEALTSLHTSCQAELEHVQACLGQRDEQVSSLIRALQMVTAQVATLRLKDAIAEPRSCDIVKQELSIYDGVIASLEKELDLHRQQWEGTVAMVASHQSTIQSLIQQEEELQREVTQREAKVSELEAVLAEVGSEKRGLEESVAEYEKALGTTRHQYQLVLEECQELRQKLQASKHDIIQQQQLLTDQLEKQEEQLSCLQKEHQSLQSEYSSCCQQLEREERLQMVTQQNYTSVLEELERSRHTVRRLEEEKDMERERCAQAIAELQAQLRVSKETNKCQNDDSASEIETMQRRSTELEDKLLQNEGLVKRLQQETIFLERQHRDVMSEVERKQQLVESLQKDLSGSQSLCDSLKLEASMFEGELNDLRSQLKMGELEKIKLSEQVVQLAGELEQVLLKLQESKQNEEEGRRDLEAILEDLRGQLDGVKSERDHLQRQKEATDRASGEHHLELLQLQDAVSRMKGQVSSYERTIRSLESQVEMLEFSLRESKAERLSMASKLTHSEGDCRTLRAELAVAKGEAVRLIRSSDKVVAKWAGQGEEVVQLERRVEELSGCEEEVEELREQVTVLEGQLEELRAKVETQHKAVQTDNESETTEQVLRRQELEEKEVELGMKEAELREKEAGLDKGQETKYSALEEQNMQLLEELHLVHDEVEKYRDGAQKREESWLGEVTQSTCELHMYQDRVRVLEGELAECREELDSVKGELRATKRILQMTKTELEVEQASKDSLQQDLLQMQQLMDRKDQELSAALSGATQHHFESLRDDLQCGSWQHQQGGEVEEESDGVRSNHSQTESDLLNPRGAYASYHVEGGGNKRCDVDEDERLGLLNELREKEDIIMKLKACNRDLSAVIESEMSSSGRPVTIPPPPPPLVSDAFINNLVARLRVDVDIGHLPKWSSVGHAAACTTVPLSFESHYTRALERGMASCCTGKPCDTGSSNTDGTVQLGRDYWMRKAGELTVQLQEATDYWSTQVRSKDLELERLKHHPHKTE